MRFTKKDRYGHFYTNEANCRNIHSLDGKKLEGEFYENQTFVIDGNAIDKLGQFEDIEEELGIDLVTIAKALKDGFYAYKGNDIVEIKSRPGNCGAMNFYASYDCIIAEDVFEQKYIYLLKEYGVTWALTREELETRKEN
jgi:hypothetical protein